MKKTTRNKMLAVISGILGGLIVSLLGAITTGNMAKNQNMGLEGIGLIMMSLFIGYFVGSAIITIIFLKLFKEKGKILHSVIAGILISVILWLCIGIINYGTILAVTYLMLWIVLIPITITTSYKYALRWKK
ncbi:hypothetical protein K9L97_05375 [Candidatus Woesearchaeota archaeon]|nr:hypothetical protein [Candidatus Woesearchaeota archaeon]